MRHALCFEWLMYEIKELVSACIGPSKGNSRATALPSRRAIEDPRAGFATVAGPTSVIPAPSFASMRGDSRAHERTYVGTWKGSSIISPVALQGQTAEVPSTCHLRLLNEALFGVDRKWYNNADC